MNKEIVLSGIRSTANLHLGNYFGAVKNFIRMQHDYTCYFFIADYHSLTTATFIVDPEGIIRFVSVNDLSVGRNVAQVLRVLDALQTGELTACGWNPGEPTLDAA